MFETGSTRLKCRLTSGDSSWSTDSVRRAARAKRFVGNGMCTVLSASQPNAVRSCWRRKAYNEQGNSGSSTAAAMVSRAGCRLIVGVMFADELARARFEPHLHLALAKSQSAFGYDEPLHMRAACGTRSHDFITTRLATTSSA